MSTDQIVPKVRSDQWNAQDFIGGPRIFTIAAIRDGKAEAQYDIDLVEGEGRCWRPPSTVLRLLIAMWGSSKSAWIGRRVELYRDPSVPFGKERVGGIRVSSVSHIDKPKTERLMTARGRYENFTVQPLADAPATPDPSTHITALEHANTIDALKTAFFAAPKNVQEHPAFIAAKEKRKGELAQEVTQ